MKDRTIIQWDKDDCEALKIVKIDLLGLGMMAVLRDSITLISEHHGDELDLYKIPMTIRRFTRLCKKATRSGCSRSRAGRRSRFCRNQNPQTFTTSSSRSRSFAPARSSATCCTRTSSGDRDWKPVTYPHESLKPILERTMGVPLFQEQLLKMAMDIAGFSGGEAEELRRAMGFKHPDKKMTKIAENLRDGMTKSNIPPEVQEQIVDYVKAFANYGFPESHAYSFALLAYASAYFIIHYRACFMAAMFNNYPLGFYSAATLVKDAQRHGLHFLPLDINRSDYLFTVEERSQWLRQKCACGLRFVKGLREEVAKKIVSERGQLARVSCKRRLAACVPTQLTLASQTSSTAFPRSTNARSAR